MGGCALGCAQADLLLSCVGCGDWKAAGQAGGGSGGDEWRQGGRHAGPLPGAPLAGCRLPSQNVITRVVLTSSPVLPGVPPVVASQQEGNGTTRPGQLLPEWLLDGPTVKPAFTTQCEARTTMALSIAERHAPGGRRDAPPGMTPCSSVPSKTARRPARGGMSHASVAGPSPGRWASTAVGPPPPSRNSTQLHTGWRRTYAGRPRRSRVSSMSKCN
mmetsp:Transcript_1841/g.5389  ORF Transcript_1841/g.5389 Transcript_1841/m.5389 type:complete len:216 (-) Transcript_1841:1351-1998(-)